VSQDEVEDGLALVDELVEQARAKPTPAALADLVLGVQLLMERAADDLVNGFKR
jgi:hypothetical protein